MSKESSLMNPVLQVLETLEAGATGSITILLNSNSFVVDNNKSLQ
jgi:hypothetical protein